MKVRLSAYSLLFVVSLGASALSILHTQTITRGVSYFASDTPRPPMQFGVNADLDQYDDSDLQRALSMIREAQFTLVRQHFYWKDIEPRAGEFKWDRWDAIVAGVKQRKLDLVAVIVTTPEWARHPGERDLAYARPASPDDYALFVAAFVRRYGGNDLAGGLYVQVWDNPNVHPFWGRRIVDPFEYTALLRAAASAARSANPNVKIISAGLAPHAELIRGRGDYSDVLFLREMYKGGARDHFDILAAKPYGMWGGSEDRRADKEIFNFSRAIVLREEMIARSDSDKPMWAVEFGWNSLPSDWQGDPSPWGNDTAAKQSARLFDGIQRVKSEWAWMPVMIAQTFQPNAPSDDPIWGFALVDSNFNPRASYSALTRAIATPAVPASFDFPRFYTALVTLILAACIAAWRGYIGARGIAWNTYWHQIELRFGAVSPLAQWAVLIAAVAAFYYSPNVVLNFALLALIVLLFALRLDAGLAVTVSTIPFYLFPKNLIGGAQFSLVEILTIASAAAMILRKIAESQARATPSPKALRLGTMDYAVALFVIAGLVSVRVADNFGVANREFRVIVLEPALLYALIRVGDIEFRNLKRLIDALILSALAIALIGLYQFFFTNYVIIGEGVRRILAVYASPNNLALYLDRVLPMLIALAIFDIDKRRRIAYLVLAIPVALCLYLTYSRAALVVGVPAGLAVVALAGGRRARVGIALLLIIGLLALVPFLQTERAQSLFQTGTGTGFFRVSVWQSAWEMGWQHPIFGVGLDNFLYEYPKYISHDAWREPNLSHPHNIVLDFWTRMGVPGLVALGWMLVAFIRAGIQSTAKVASTRGLVVALMAGMAATLAHGMIDAAYFFVDLAFVWMLMMGVGTQLYVETSKQVR